MIYDQCWPWCTLRDRSILHRPGIHATTFSHIDRWTRRPDAWYLCHMTIHMKAGLVSQTKYEHHFEHKFLYLIQLRHRPKTLLKHSMSRHGIINYMNTKSTSEWMDSSINWQVFWRAWQSKSNDIGNEWFWWNSNQINCEFKQNSWSFCSFRAKDVLCFQLLDSIACLSDLYRKVLRLKK